MSAKAMRIMYQKYRDDWEKYPQSQDSRRMRLTEFMWSQCKPTHKCQYDKYDPRGYDMNDPMEKKLYDCTLRNRQTRAELDEIFKTNSPVDTDDDMSDNISSVSRLSQQSLVDFFGKDSSDKIDGSYHPSVVLPESDSEASLKLNNSEVSSLSSSKVSTKSCFVLHVNNTVNNNVPTDSMVSPPQTVNWAKLGCLVAFT